MSASHFILLVEGDRERTDALATGFVRLGVEPIRVADLAEAVAVAKSRAYVLSAVAVPADVPGRPLYKAMKSLRRREPGLPAMAFGKPPGAEQARALRHAGVLLALWDGYDEGRLRFQLNRLVSAESASPTRGARRVPVHAPVRIRIGGREKRGTLYSLSETGCFIESPRASMDGAQLELEFHLARRAFALDGRVVFANVPGNLQRPNLPLGMGIRFENLPEIAAMDLEQLIQEISESLEV